MTRKVTIHQRSAPPRGFTLIEILVTIGALGALAALLLPAMLAARGSARQNACRNHLHQFGVAYGNFAATEGYYPTVTRLESPLRLLLPYFGHKPLLDQLRRQQQGELVKIESLYVEAYGCPDDSILQANMASGDCGYLLNAGTFRGRGFNASHTRDARPSDFTDGHSCTVAMSERLTFNWRRRPGEVDPDDPLRHMYWTERRYAEEHEFDLRLDQCHRHRTGTIPQVQGPHNANLHFMASYHHVFPPNVPGCYNGPESFITPQSLYSATSYHPGGVHSLLVDGAVRFVNELIDMRVWEAISTRSGGESEQLRF